MADQDIENAVELICQKGCKLVWQDITVLESGESLPETGGLSAVEITRVVDELKTIMSVYTDTCSPY